MIVDLRSDTVTRPTTAMRQAMHCAELGDDVFGDASTVNALQQRIADMLGKEAALFMPSGTQSNLAAIMSHCGRGDELIVGQGAHCYRYEAGGAAVLGSVQPQPLPNQADGSLALGDIEAAIEPDGEHFARSRLLALENTLGGKVLPMYGLSGRSHGADPAPWLGHAPGRRAAVQRRGGAGRGRAGQCQGHRRALRQRVGVLQQGAGCAGGLGAGGLERSDPARPPLAQDAGGGMRQAGMPAAAASHALEHHIDRLAENHELAAGLAEGLNGIDALSVPPPQTNIVFVNVRGGHGPELLAHLKARGVLVTGLAGLRFVTHLDVDRAGIDRAISAVHSFFEEH